MSSAQTPPPSPAAPLVLPTATLQLRLAAGALTALFTAMVLGLALAIGWLGRGPDESLLDAALAPLVVAGVAWLLMVLGIVRGTAASPGQWVLGLCQVDVTDGQPSGPRALVKELLLLGFGLVTVGVGVLVMLGMYRGDQNVLDRLAGTRVLQRRGRGVAGEGAGFLSALLHTQPHHRLDRPAAAPGGGVASVEIVLDRGTRLVMDRPRVLGRNPQPQPGHPGAEPFLVPDVDRTLSKSHVVLTPVPGGLMVTDLYSMNGVRLRFPDATEHHIEPGRSAFAPVGSVLLWGARTLQVLPC